MNANNPMTTVIPVVLSMAMALSGCDAGGTRMNSVTDKLLVAGKASTANAAVIPIRPESASKRKRSRILTAKLRAEKQPLSVQTVAVRLQATASLSSVLHQAVLAYADNTYPLDHIVSRGDSSGFLVFEIPSEDPLTVSEKPEELELLVEFQADAHKEQVQASIDATAKQKTVVTQDGRKLTSEQKIGFARGEQYSLQRHGAHLTVENLIAQQTKQGIRFEADIQIAAVGAHISFPWQSYRKESSANEYPDVGLYYTVEDTSASSMSIGRVQATTLESTSVVPANARSASGLRIEKSRERTVTLSVRYQPDTKVASMYCFRLDALKYRMKGGQAHLQTVSDTTQTDCVRG